MNITNVDAVPSPTGCNHVTLQCDIDGVTQKRTYVRTDLLVPVTAEEKEAAILTCLRIHIKDSGLTNAAQIRANLQAWSFTI